MMRVLCCLAASLCLVSSACDDGERVVLDFGGDFRFGAATAAHQVEGGQQNNWTWWETLPQFSDYVVEPSGLACDHYNRYEEDLDLAGWMGLDTFRLSIEWSRIEPEAGVYDEAEIEHYRQVFEAMASRGIRPSVSLHHFTEPQWFLDMRELELPANDTFCAGDPSETRFCYWSDERAAEAFGEFCRRMGEAFGQYVDEWMTFNEMGGYWLGTSVSGDFPPGLQSMDWATMESVALPVLRGLMDAHAACYRALHEADGVDADGDGEAARVGFTTGTGAARPADPSDDEQIAAAEQMEYVATLMLFDAAVNGVLDADFDTVAEEEHPEWAGTLDLIGLQYYASTRIVDISLVPFLDGVPCADPPRCVSRSALLPLYNPARNGPPACPCRASA